MKMIFRSWWRNKLSTAISVVSLTVGLVCSLMLLLFVLGEYRVAGAVGDGQNVYMVEQRDVFSADQNAVESSTSPNRTYRMAEKYSQIEYMVSAHSGDWRFKETDNSNQGHYRVTSHFADMFDIPVVAGDLHAVLHSPDMIAVTNSFMLEMYGRPAVLGDRINAVSGENSWINGKPAPVVDHLVSIGAVLDEAQKLPFNFSALSLMSESEIIAMGDVTLGLFYNFVKLGDRVDVDQFTTIVKADTLLMKNGGDDLRFTSWDNIYFDASPRSVNSRGNDFIVRRDPAIVSIGLAVALLILLIAVFNYVNITMTRARERLRNVAAQRIFGASAREVRWQTVLDTALLVLFCFALSLVVIDALVPQFNAFMDSRVAVTEMFEACNVLVVIGLLLMLVFLPSFYILWKIGTRSAIESLKNTAGRALNISSVLVVAQFAISVVLMVVGWNIARQMNFVASNIASTRTIVSLSPSSREGISSSYVDRLVSQAYVAGYSLNSPCRLSGSMSINGEVNSLLRGDEDFLSFYGIRLVEGRGFTSSDTLTSILVNEEFVKQKKLQPPVEGQVYKFNNQTNTIVGVVEDFMFADARQPIGSLMIEYVGKSKTLEYAKWGLFVKVTGNPDQRIDDMRELWAADFYDTPMPEIKSVATLYKEMHPAEERLLTIVEIFMVISGLLTVLGLFGLAFYSVARRRREIALRKIHGSTAAGIVWRLCLMFGVWVGVACVIALPVAYFLSVWWLQSFVYRVEIAWWVFAATVGAAVCVTLLTVIYQTYRAANANPANSIKTE